MVLRNAKSNLNLSKLRGQGYDGAANMRGVFEANNLKVHMEDFQFIFSVIFIGKILETVNVVSKVLQSPNKN